MVTYFAKWLERYGTMGKYGFMDLFGKKSWSKPDRIHLGLLWLLEHLYRQTNHELLSLDFVVWIFAECPVCGWCSIPAVQRRLWGWSLVSCQMSGGSWCDAATRTGLIHWRDFFSMEGRPKYGGNCWNLTSNQRQCPLWAPDSRPASWDIKSSHKPSCSGSGAELGQLCTLRRNKSEPAKWGWVHIW